MAKLFRVSFHSTSTTGVAYVSTYHYVVRPAGGFTDTGDASNLRDALSGTLPAQYRGVLPNWITVQTMLVAEVLPPGSTDVPDESSFTVGLNGQQSTTGDQLPIPLCVLVGIYSNAAVRSGHGRTFYPHPGNASLLDSAGNWDMASTVFATSYPTLLNSLKSNWTVDLSGTPDATASQVIYSRTRHARGDDSYYFDVSSWTIRTVPHWLRSRATAP